MLICQWCQSGYSEKKKKKKKTPLPFQLHTLEVHLYTGLLANKIVCSLLYCPAGYKNVHCKQKGNGKEERRNLKTETQVSTNFVHASPIGSHSCQPDGFLSHGIGGESRGKIIINDEGQHNTLYVHICCTVQTKTSYKEDSKCHKGVSVLQTLECVSELCCLHYASFVFLHWSG